jgi:hypothetical protein
VVVVLVSRLQQGLTKNIAFQSFHIPRQQISTLNTANISDSNGLTSKIPSYLTRNLTTASGDVTITLGFKPSALICVASVDGASSSSIGFSDSSKSSHSLIFMNNLMYSQGAAMLAYVGTQVAVNYQVITVKSYNDDGVTLTWTKVGNPTGIAYYNILALK